MLSKVFMNTVYGEREFETLDFKYITVKGGPELDRVHACQHVQHA
jgi:hypothetical protein